MSQNDEGPTPVAAGASDLTNEDIRIVQALADFQMALSAFDFICELDEDQSMTRVERRRYRCFEDAAVIAYWRPFTQSKGLPSLSLKKIGVRPTAAQLDLHERLRMHRNEVVAHTDVVKMRLALSTFKIFEGRDIMLPHYDFDDSLVFFAERYALIDWLRTLRAATTRTVFDRTQGRSEIRFKRDHLDNSSILPPTDGRVDRCRSL
ncbi:hypothetical protein [Methylobacterium radiotolerans]|uniref:hypothetical protein n=1 Tax=Methylobacterium radiotolerans TaxID=31998 RepID=UPI0011157D80|nr:hypothetical protein [Methylobacterium radiotolerans]